VARRHCSQEYDGTAAGVDTGVRVVITNTSGRGVILNGFTMDTDDSQGNMISQHTISSGITGAGDLPRFLAPGESDSFVLDFRDLTGVVSISTHNYLHSSCAVSGWQ
jgi:hypothetical protein